MAIKIAKSNLFSFFSSFNKKPAEISIGAPLNVVVNPKSEQADLFRKSIAEAAVQRRKNLPPGSRNGSNRYSIIRPPLRPAPVPPVPQIPEAVELPATPLLPPPPPPPPPPKRSLTRDASVQKHTSRKANTAGSRIQSRKSINQRLRKSSVGRVAAAAIAKLNINAAANDSVQAAMKTAMKSPWVLKDSNKQFARLGVHIRAGSFEGYRIREVEIRKNLREKSKHQEEEIPPTSPIPPVPPIPSLKLRLPSIPTLPRFPSIFASQEYKTESPKIEDEVVPAELSGERAVAELDASPAPSLLQVSSEAVSPVSSLSSHERVSISLSSPPSSVDKDSPTLGPSYVLETASLPEAIASKLTPESGSISDLRLRRQAKDLILKLHTNGHHHHNHHGHVPRTATSPRVTKHSNSSVGLRKRRGSIGQRTPTSATRSPYEPYDLDAILAAYA